MGAWCSRSVWGDIFLPGFRFEARPILVKKSDPGASHRDPYGRLFALANCLNPGHKARAKELVQASGCLANH